MKQAYEIHEANLGRITDLVTKLNKRAVKLNLDPIVVTQGAPIQRPRRHECIAGPGLCTKCRILDTFIPVTIEGQAPVIAGWTFVAALDYLTDDTGAAQVILRVAPGHEVPESYRSTDRSCDHCKLARKRNSTYVVKHDVEGFAQIGSNCLKDFLGHTDPEKVAAFLDGLLSLFRACGEAEEFSSESGGRSNHTYLATVLALSAAAIEQHGWVSSKNARETERESTASQVRHELGALFCRDHQRHAIVATDAHGAEAEAVIEWAQNLDTTNSDYLHNVRVLSNLSIIDLKYLGIAVSMVAVYRREQDKLREATRPVRVSQHVGVIGKRQKMTLTVLDQKSFDGNYGVTTLIRFSDADGNIVKWFASGNPGYVNGKTYEVKATVKKHDTFRGVSETLVNRVA